MGDGVPVRPQTCSTLGAETIFFAAFHRFEDRFRGPGRRLFGLDAFGADDLPELVSYSEFKKFL